MNKLFVLFLLISSPATAGIYKWVDSDGNIHFGDRPADQDAATELTIKSNNHTGITNSSGHDDDREYLLKKIEEDKHEKSEKNKERLAENKKRLKRCENYKRKYQRHIRSNSLYTVDAEGERSYLSDKERETRKKKLEKSISKHCR